MNRLRQNEPQWKGNQQQINNQISKSPQKQNDHHSMNNMYLFYLSKNDE